MTAATGARIVRGAAWSAAESWGRHLFSFVIVVVLARQLDAEAFGLAALAMVAPVILGVLVINGIPEALVQRSELEPIHLYSAFWLLVSVGLTASLLILLAAAPMAWACRTSVTTPTTACSTTIASPISGTTTAT